MSKKEKIMRWIESGQKSVNDIAKLTDYPRGRVMFMLKQWNVKIPKRKNYERIPMPARDELKRMYDKHRTVRKLAEAYDVSTDTVRKWLKTSKVPMRKLIGSDQEKMALLELDIENMKI